MSTRREFIRHSALATAAAAAGLPLTGTGSNVITEGDRTTSASSAVIFIV